MALFSHLANNDLGRGVSYQGLGALGAGSVGVGSFVPSQRDGQLVGASEAGPGGQVIPQVIPHALLPGLLPSSALNYGPKLLSTSGKRKSSFFLPSGIPSLPKRKPLVKLPVVVPPCNVVAEVELLVLPEVVEPVPVLVGLGEVPAHLEVEPAVGEVELPALPEVIELVPVRVEPGEVPAQAVHDELDAEDVPDEILLPPLTKSGPLGEQGEVLSKSLFKQRSSEAINLIMSNSIADSTKRQYSLVWALFKNFGLTNGVFVDKCEFDFSFVCEFFLFRIQNNSSFASILSARSAIRHYWCLKSAFPSPTDSHFVDLFIRGLKRKFSTVPNKAFPISYDDLVKIFDAVVGTSSLEEISLVNLRFITFIITLYSSFGRYEEVSNLKLSNVERENCAWLLYFKKGKNYQIGESNLGVVVNLPGLKFNPSDIFSLYFEKISYLYSLSELSSDFLFPSFRSSKLHGVIPLDHPVSYSVISSKFKFLVKQVNIPVGMSKVGLHCMRRGGVTHAVRAGAPHSVVQKAMRVKSQSMVGYYATLRASELSETAKLAF